MADRAAGACGGRARWRAAAVALVALALAAAAGCGGGTPEQASTAPAAGPLSRDAYARAVAQDMDRVRDALAPATASPPGMSVEELAGRLGRARDTLTAIADDLRRLDPPAGAEDLNPQLVSGVEEMAREVGALQDLLDRLRTGEIDSLDQLLELLAGVGLDGATTLEEARWLLEEHGFDLPEAPPS